MSYTVSQRVPHGTERQVPPVVTHSSLDWPPSCPAGQLFTVPLPVNLNSWKRTVVWKRWWRWDTSLNSRTDAPGAEGLISAPDAFPEPRTQLGGNPPYPLPPCQRSHLTSLTAASLSSKSLPREKKKKMCKYLSPQSLAMRNEKCGFSERKMTRQWMVPGPQVWQVRAWFIQGHRRESLSAWSVLFLISCNCCSCFQGMVLCKKIGLLPALV